MTKEGRETSVDKEKVGQDCITVTIVENPKNSVQLDAVRNMMIPFLLGAAIKGWCNVVRISIRSL